jgi:hypothetical protein
MHFESLERGGLWPFPSLKQIDIINEYWFSI